MAHIDTVLKQLDSEVIATVKRGGDLNQLPIADWQAFVPGFVKRNAVTASAQRTRGLVAEKIYCAVWNLRWDLPSLIERSFLAFPYDQVQLHLSFLNLLWKLLADSVLYLAAQEAAKTETARAVSAAPAAAKRYWDEWDNWNEGDVRRPCEWDIERVNHTANELANLAAYLTLFASETEIGADPHDFAGAVAAALPDVQAFQAHFPTFCAVLNEANVLNLTEKIIVREPVELKVALPTTEATRAKTSITAHDSQWAGAMIQHHQGAIDMAETGLKKVSNAQLKKFMKGVISAQSEERDFLEQFVDPEKDADEGDVDTAEMSRPAGARLPTVTVAEKAHPWRPLAQVEKANSTADFQGFFIGIVLEPRAEDDRDLDNCYMSREEIEKACDHWSIHHQKIRVNHDPDTEGGAFEHEDYRCIRNWIEYGEPIIGGYPVRAGTWLQAYQCMSEQAKSDVENHVINGLSPNGPVTIWKDKPKEEAA